MSQAHGSSLWQESAGSGAVPTATSVVFQLVAGKWTPVVGGAAQARLLDVRGTGTFMLIDVRSEYALATVRTGVVAPTAGGTAAAVMAKTGAKYYAAVVGAATQAARFFVDACRGKLQLVPTDASETLLVLVGTKVRSY